MPNIEQTKEMLAKHHRGGEQFAELMKTTFANRFTEAFWQQWQQWMVPVYGEQAVVMDLGCGPGLFLHALHEHTPGVQAIGVEVADYMIEAAGELPPHARILQSDLHEPHFELADNSVDAALSSVVIHEMNQPIKALQELHRCLKPGGRFYLIDWVRGSLESYIQAESDEDKVFAADTPAAELDDLLVHYIEHNRFALADLFYLLNHTGFAILHSQTVREGRFAHIIAEKRG